MVLCGTGGGVGADLLKLVSVGVRAGNHTCLYCGKVPFWNLCVIIRYSMENAVSVNVKLSESLVDQAKSHAQVQHRSVPKQIEYWSQIGKIAEENPDLPFFMIRDILIADQEAVVGEYVFS